jgi:hypothetical protein
MTNNKHKFPYKWNLADGYPAKGIAKNECNVFGTFICGGGSTMGYKLAGFNHLGGVEIDVKVADVYKENHKPKYLFVEDIRAFNKRTDLPTELYNLRYFRRLARLVLLLAWQAAGKRLGARQSSSERGKRCKH